MTVRPAKTQNSLGTRPVWSESSLCTQWVAKDPSFLRVDSEDSDQTGRINFISQYLKEKAGLKLNFEVTYFYNKPKYLA